jgi:rod shape-determining protein MreC
MARVIAPVSSNSPTNFAATIDIAKGRRDGVLAGMAVVANGGLVGRVISTTAHGATVRLITDQRSVIGVAFGDGSTNALLYGRGATRPLALSDIPQSAVVTKGTVLATNSLEGSAFPPGLPVATVQQATLSPGSANYNLVLAPAADLAHLSYVDVVLWEPGS